MIGLFARRRRTLPATRRVALPAHAVLAGMNLWDGRRVERIVTSLATGDDRTAGRWCAECNEFGSHHTDRHIDFLTITATVEQMPIEDGSGTFTSRTLTWTGREQVDLTDFPGTRVRASDQPLAVISR